MISLLLLIFLGVAIFTIRNRAFWAICSGVVSIWLLFEFTTTSHSYFLLFLALWNLYNFIAWMRRPREAPPR